MEPEIQTKDFDDFYLIIGKALFIASDFENDLKALSIYLQIRMNPSVLSNSDLLLPFFEKYQSASKRVKKIDLQADVRALFDRAIQSRNYIAHQLALSIYNHEGDEYSLNRFIETEIKPNVENVLIAANILKSFLAEMNDEDRAHNWIERQKNWAFSYDQ